MQQIIHLTPPHLSPEHVEEKISCIRAHRERLFRVDTELRNNKLICHNYGQGGAGWTFLFGCVNESLRLFEQRLQESSQFKNKPIAVIGAGCYGLLTAIMLARTGHPVRIIAKETENLPSYKAAGFFFPRARTSSTPEEIAIFRARGMESYANYLEIIRGEHPFMTAGPKLLPGYFGLAIDPGFGPYLAQGLIEQPKKVTITFGGDKRYGAMEYQTLFLDASIMMRQLNQELQRLRIPVARVAVGSLDELDDPIIFNCAGMGAKDLANDARMVPVQGHLIALKNQPPMEQLNYLINVKVLSTNPQGMPRDELIYYAPKGTGILGVTFLRGQDQAAENGHEFERLMQRAQHFFGS